MKYSTPRPPHLNNGKGLNKALLPDVREYLIAQGIEPKGRTLWIKVVCPFHDDKAPSLSINTQKGCFKCFACEAKGGDIIAFHMQLKGIGFVEACKQLGAWEES
ncbi:CHC2 zinc finger domain-containing protein [Acinetobacter populi]|jgi:hypothetical protein|uniref:Zinc finger CHC2-type domain-containing protein n=1 Tax=Acinetobacter populi TaxID=1582270 RepID=A0A1Z9Z3I2_9GAMM|nr:CHC2 zinc finger domain-containing protein [Acinetobacter populi]MCH4248862.1 CHC2 zinc finger domain-containing protein [Acinetobacter populi]OUY09031.1 hypothetical protein CAP51_05365 [Acinetobacter populi]